MLCIKESKKKKKECAYDSERQRESNEMRFTHTHTPTYDSMQTNNYSALRFVRFSLFFTGSNKKKREMNNETSHQSIYLYSALFSHRRREKNTFR